MDNVCIRRNIRIPRINVLNVHTVSIKKINQMNLKVAANYIGMHIIFSRRIVYIRR
jgi:hypothetical protein